MNTGCILLIMLLVVGLGFATVALLDGAGVFNRDSSHYSFTNIEPGEHDAVCVLPCLGVVLVAGMGLVARANRKG